jgi:hypothetical protein
MAHVEFDFCALHYMNQWLSGDRLRCDEIASDKVDEKLAALEKYASDYKIARTLLRKHDADKGLPRYKPVLDIIQSAKRGDFLDEKLAPSIDGIADRISKQYGDRKVLSATTKFLWLMLKSPIIIYDSRCRAALGTKPDDIFQYVHEWRDMFKNRKREIEVSCQNLTEVRSYMNNTERTTPEYIENTSSQEWFKERVFDTFLWHSAPVETE